MSAGEIDHSSGRKSLPVGRIDANVRPLFFVSYAHDFGEDDEYVRQFHVDLSRDVRLHSGLRDDRLGFCDTSLQAGDRWSPALVDALRKCQVFLALCSPTYFNRPSCGKEWTIFARRLAAAPDAGPGGSAGSLLPLFWVPMTMPAVAAPYQYRDRAFGPAYQEQGLRDLIRLTLNRDHYRSFVTALARRVLELAGQVRVPADRRRPEFDAVPPAFPAQASADRAVPPSPIPHQSDREDGQYTVDFSVRWPTRPVLNPLDPPPRPAERRPRRLGHGRGDGTDDSRGRGVTEGDPL
jgi:hypothetical protein